MPMTRGRNGSGFLARVVEQALGRELLLALLQQRHQRADAGRLQRVDDDLVGGLARIGGDAPGGDHLQPFGRLELEALHGGAPDHRLDLGLVVLQREVAVAGGVGAAEAGDLPAQAHVAVGALQRALDGGGRAPTPSTRQIGCRPGGLAGGAVARPRIALWLCSASASMIHEVGGSRGQSHGRLSRAFAGSWLMNVLLIGSGGREHALAWAMSASPLLTKLYCAPGNAGIAEVAECVALDVADHAAVVRFCAREAHRFLSWSARRRRWWPALPTISRPPGIKVFGPSKAAAQLEGSKGFTKDLCREFAIPTAAYGRFAERARGQGLPGERSRCPIVVKADGLAAGKGVSHRRDARGGRGLRSMPASPAPSARRAPRS